MRPIKNGTNATCTLKKATPMIPIHQLLNRIRWDKEFGQGSFEIGYLDQVEQRILRIPLHEAHFEKGNRFSFDLEALDGTIQTIPFHRVREVHKNGHLIWRRPAPGQETPQDPSPSL
jgi:uncharacterized protein (UPF0248 family)